MKSLLESMLRLPCMVFVMLVACKQFAVLVCCIATEFCRVMYGHTDGAECRPPYAVASADRGNADHRLCTFGVQLA
jgi:hypothetical protein